MEEKKRVGKFEYEKPELVDMMRAGASGQEECNPFGSSAGDSCYDGTSPGLYCGTGTGVGP